MIMQSIDLLNDNPNPSEAGDPRAASRATCAGAPATTTSSAPCRPPRASRPTLRRGERVMTVTEEPTATAQPEIGRARRRKEDQRLITGRTRWTDNIQLTGMLHIAMVRSPFAHAKITNIDTVGGEGAAQRGRGAHRRGPRGGPGRDHQRLADHPRAGGAAPTCRCAVDRVAFAGEIVAVVVARTAAEARDAAELVDVDYEELPAALDLQASPRRTRCSRTPTSAPTSRRTGPSTPPRRGAVVLSTRRSRRPAPRASWSSASSASNG